MPPFSIGLKVITVRSAGLRQASEEGFTIGGWGEAAPPPRLAADRAGWDPRV